MRVHIKHQLEQHQKQDVNPETGYDAVGMIMKSKLKEEVLIGHEQIERGEGMCVNSKEEFMKLIRGCR
ncbi:MAG: hypothetical protein EOP88_05265 [Verrucomicrobiaceae bacterium]|jgi:hypothetical protein|nr:MAG: hypothetical protein EOP88_05265 [Verrucomicrobiaceae bacterium]